MTKLITRETLTAWGACSDGAARFNELWPDGADLATASAGLIADGHDNWSSWLWSKCKLDDNYCQQTIIAAGDYGTATAGYRGTATAGYRGTATAGNRGTATAGDYGTATAGDRGTATAGDYGCLVLKHYSKGRYFVRSANVGLNGIKPNTAYKLDESGENFVEVSK